MVSTQPTDRTPSLGSRVGNARSILLLSPRMAAADADACRALLASETPRDTTAILLSFRGAPDEWLDEVVGRRDWSVRIVDVGGSRGDSTVAGDRRVGTGTSVAIESVAEPGDLTSVGVALTSQLQAARREGHRIVGCVDSLTTLLHCVDLQRAFRFLHATTGRFERADATVHCHLDPAAHEARTVNTVKQLFDAVVEVGEDGDATVTTREP